MDEEDLSTHGQDTVMYSEEEGGCAKEAEGSVQVEELHMCVVHVHGEGIEYDSEYG